MAVIVLDEGLTDRMAGFYGASESNPPDTLRLYASVAGTLGPDTVLADFTEIAAVMGYSEASVLGSDWSFLIDLASHWDIATATYTWPFTPGPGLVIVGWYLLNSAVGRAQLAEEFAAPVIIPAAGGSLELLINDKYQACP